MTDTERMNKIERKKQEIIEKLLGPGMPFADQVKEMNKPKQHTMKKNTGPRILKDMNPSADDRWLSGYNRQMHTNHGKIITHVDAPLEVEVAAPIK